MQICEPPKPDGHDLRRRRSVGEFDCVVGRPQPPEYYEEVVIFSRTRCYPEHILEYDGPSVAPPL